MIAGDGKFLISIKPRYYVTKEAEELLRDANKAKNILYREPTIAFEQLVFITANLKLKKIK